jgi:hypothetical protein
MVYFPYEMAGRDYAITPYVQKREICVYLR